MANAAAPDPADSPEPSASEGPGAPSDAALARLDRLSSAEAIAWFTRCCGARRWAEAMARARPFRDREALFETASRVWWALGREDWLEAFAHHPRIGDVEQLRERFGEAAAHSVREQAGVRGADEQTLRALAEGNRAYEARFGWIFLVCASGKSAHEMLELLRTRLGNDPETELRIAAAEQEKITRIRLEKQLRS